jgi:hypothetical protein
LGSYTIGVHDAVPIVFQYFSDTSSHYSQFFF